MGGLREERFGGSGRGGETESEGRETGPATTKKKGNKTRRPVSVLVGDRQQQHINNNNYDVIRPICLALGQH